MSERRFSCIYYPFFYQCLFIFFTSVGIGMIFKHLILFDSLVCILFFPQVCEWGVEGSHPGVSLEEDRFVNRIYLCDFFYLQKSFSEIILLNELKCLGQQWSDT